MMEIKVKYFGSVAEETGKNEEKIQVEDSIMDISEFKKYIFTRYGIDADDSIRVAINQTLQQKGEIQHGDEIAFLPPYAGG